MPNGTEAPGKLSDLPTIAALPMSAADMPTGHQCAVGTLTTNNRIATAARARLRTCVPA